MLTGRYFVFFKLLLNRYFWLYTSDIYFAGNTSWESWSGKFDYKILKNYFDKQRDWGILYMGHSRNALRQIIEAQKVTVRNIE